MRRILISDTDWVQSGTFAGGSWTAAGPLANIPDSRPQLVAQSTNATAAFSQFTVDLGAARSVGLFYFANLIVSAAATVRVRAGTDPTFAAVLYDTTALPALPQDASGSISMEEWIALGRTRIFVPTAPVTVRYILVEIDDHTAAAAPMLGCFCASSVYEVSINPLYGETSITPMDESDVNNVPFGATYFLKKGMRHRFNVGWNALPQTATFTQLMRLVRVKGITTPLVVTIFPEDISPVISLERTSVYGTFSKSSPFTFSFFARYANAQQIDQLI